MRIKRPRSILLTIYVFFCGRFLLLQAKRKRKQMSEQRIYLRERNAKIIKVIEQMSKIKIEPRKNKRKYSSDPDVIPDNRSSRSSSDESGEQAYQTNQLF